MKVIKTLESTVCSPTLVRCRLQSHAYNLVFRGVRPSTLYMQSAHYRRNGSAGGVLPCGLINQLRPKATPNVAARHTNTVWVNLPTVAA